MSALSPLTPHQATIFNLLKTLESEVSAQMIYAELRQQKHRLGLATVYRGLKHLQLQGAVQARLLSNGEAVYSLVSEEKLYVTCVKCGISVPLAYCPIDEQVLPQALSLRFKIFYHTLEFFGLCSPCLEQETVA
ncbi:transcriptional repressor [Synechococcales cyanobacterium C]|uniref:Transcriptional repressor n=1 Tax=Petrachloros mirabilis ULC683 TaxID=2781853 RepID=A0A8K1ZYT6_9CYAN|nr:Fur family transcriptional regulator [Petrachloros mirabilis]NCJ07815.1 transcriptional repressor [Petrachloros mirabilis ULC683]